MDTQFYLHWTYRQLRLAAATVLVVGTVAIVLIGWFKLGRILPTLSHYYFSEDPAGLLRTLFTGMLIFVGGVMICYRGFDDRDNNVLNLAGGLALAVAFFPKQCDRFDIKCTEYSLSFLHMPAAVLLFFVAAYAVWYCGGKALSDRLNEREKTHLTRWKTASLLCMFSGVSFYVPHLFGIAPAPLTVALIVEMTGFFGFSFFWMGTSHVVFRANQRIAKANGTPEDTGRLTPRAKIEPLIP
ncbi:MAG: hypothetical protein C4K60_02985 [Ideonella sp. MAG2]|nr:MAG: hypothetical protein C4K60_02985 [Ideonella sp. MAG2]